MEITEFEKQVYVVVRKISKGKTMTYAQVAAAIGRPRATRAVGNALNKNPFSFADGGEVACHRVIRSDGSVGGFASGSKKKLQLLKKEGVMIGE